ncbi:MAG TPA: energy-coupling factor transporter transmembrane component T [Ktedonobacteraceae bacterium]|nr:energy-coupling factor transporter transmembrane component T [Ktedonobacteraceae bacterium]
MLFKNIPLGIYYPGNSLIHRLQARTKLLLLCWIVAYLVIANRRQWHFAPYIVIVTLTCVAVRLSGVSFREIWQRMWLLVVLVILGAIPTLFTTEDTNQPLSSLGPVVTSYGFARQMLLMIGAVSLALFLASLLPGVRNLWHSRWARRIRILLATIVIAAVLTLWLISGPAASAPLPIGPFVITYLGVWLQVAFFVVLLVLFTLSLLLTMTTSPVALIEGLTMLLSPLRRIKLPVDDFALMVLLALRFIPTLVEEVEQLMKAQTSRGADLANGTIRERMQSLATMLVPLVQGALRRASDLSTALEARGYEVEGRQTYLHEQPFGRVDYAVLIVVGALTIGALIP